MNWLANNQPTIWAALWAHLALSLPPIAASFLISLPLGWAAHRHRWLRFPVVTGSSLMYAIPSLPLLIVLPVALTAVILAVRFSLDPLRRFRARLEARSRELGIDYARLHLRRRRPSAPRVGAVRCASCAENLRRTPGSRCYDRCVCRP